MIFYKVNSVLCALFFYTQLVTTLALCEDPFLLYVIRSVASGNVMDSRNAPSVQLQHFDATTNQQWHFERGSEPGHFYVLNEATGMALDIGQYNNKGGYFNIILSPLDPNSEAQQWYINRDGTITNVYNSMTLDAPNSGASRTSMVLSTINGTPQQLFTAQRKS